MKKQYLMALLLSACATASLTDGGRGVRFVTQSPSGCKYLGEVEGDYRGSAHGAIISDPQGAARIDIKNKTAALGGDTVQVLERDDSSVKGEAYSCGPGSAAK